ncbi:MAG: glycosyltransferase family 2 protein [Sulfuricaulis sp.]|uniref:glycosyltransferase family 2 protein n=1 Tax=Sulfuricaulis sp. TaxID=2003553 RepID=UPI0025CBC211|nr:glycosyltransferase family 2 protein [Sulfuricaulis sp.]MCR4347758.1 glycosyltransferase family 2 protein [Sulfuricaulis sp.]
MSPKIGVIIPARDEEDSIAHVLRDIPADLSPCVVVVNNRSTDRTAEIARAHGAVVINEQRPGYGRVMLTGLEYFARHPVDIVVFLDGDYSDYPAEMGRLVQPIVEEGYDLVLSTRLNPLLDKESLGPHVIYGNKLVVFLMNLLSGSRYTDLGPFRAIRYDALRKLDMRDLNYGWTVEMQAKAWRLGLKVMEVPMRYRKRIGQSKISGTIKGTVLAGSKMIYMVFRRCLWPRRR